MKKDWRALVAIASTLGSGIYWHNFSKAYAWWNVAEIKGGKRFAPVQCLGGCAEFPSKVSEPMYLALILTIMALVVMLWMFLRPMKQ